MIYAHFGGPEDEIPMAKMETRVVPQLIGLTGPAGVGKDFIADALVQHFGYTKLRFADRLKRMLALFYDVPVSLLENREWKETVGSYCLTPREAMETLGTEWGRNMIDPDVWVDRTLERPGDPAPRYPRVISDCRFPNEASVFGI